MSVFHLVISVFILNIIYPVFGFPFPFLLYNSVPTPVHIIDDNTQRTKKLLADESNHERKGHQLKFFQRL